MRQKIQAFWVGSQVVRRKYSRPLGVGWLIGAGCALLAAATSTQAVQLAADPTRPATSPIHVRHCPGWEVEYDGPVARLRRNNDWMVLRCGPRDATPTL